jgi:hypothetical protein
MKPRHGQPRKQFEDRQDHKRNLFKGTRTDFTGIFTAEVTPLGEKHFLRVFLVAWTSFGNCGKERGQSTE